MRRRVGGVTIKDCIVQTFRAGGPGGQNQNKRDTAVRVVHPPSGAVGESREHRFQLQNKRQAFKRMAETHEFQSWCRAYFIGMHEDELDSRFVERVRSYNMLEKRIVDHKTGKKTSRIDDVLDGDLDLLR